MNPVIDLADRNAIRDTYGDCKAWRAKGRILRRATPQDFSPFDPAQLIPERNWYSLLELGCGLEGWIEGVIAKAETNARVYAYDISEDVLRFFSREYTTGQGARPNPYCVIGDGEHLPFAAHSFDAISAVFVGHHMKNAETFVSELAHVLKPEGWFLTNSLDWNFPPPDFPSQGLQRLLGKPASFIVQNAFDEATARRELNRFFGDVREKRIAIPATFQTVDDLLRLHSRLEYFIRRVLPVPYEWSAYLRCVQQVAENHIRRNGSYFMELAITYFIAQRPRVGVV